MLLSVLWWKKRLKDHELAAPAAQQSCGEEMAVSKDQLDIQVKMLGTKFQHDLKISGEHEMSVR